MNPAERKALKTRHGQALRNFLNDATNGQTTSRTDLVARLRDGAIPEAFHDDLLAAYRKTLEAARGEGANRFEVRQQAAADAVGWLRKIRAADDILGEHGIPEGTPDTAAAEEQADRVLAYKRGLDDQQYEEEKAAKAERARLKALGVPVDG